MPIQVSMSYQNSLNLKISGSVGILRDMKEYFTEYSPGYEFDYRYKAGRWNGKISLFNRQHRELPYGLLGEMLRFKKEFYPNEQFTFSEDVKKLFKGIDLQPKWDLTLTPRDYQEECILKALKIGRGVLRAGTGSGKSIIITYIWKTLFENELTNRSLLIVPNLNLITQFHSDLLEYGVDPDLIGEVWAKEKQWDKKLVISTWQSLQNFPTQCIKFNSVFVDEVHGFKSINAKDMLQKLSNARWRFGFTGTLPETRLDNLNVMAYLGPVFKEVSTQFLIDNGYLTPVTIKQIELNYKKAWDPVIPGKPRASFQDVKDAIFHNSFRLSVIKDYLTEIKDNVKILLVTKVEDEGEFLKDYLLGIEELSQQEIIFMSGKTKKEEREEIRQKAIANDHPLIIISTYPILQAGVNIPALAHVFFASPSKSKIRLLQSIGRALRLSKNKETAYIYDFIDMNNRFFDRQAMVREKYYDLDGFNREQYSHYEKDYKIFN